MIQGKNLYLFKKSPKERSTIVIDLNRAHVSSIDTPTLKMCPNGAHTGFYINFGDKKLRKIYFLSFDQMQECIKAILKAQGFTERVD